MTKPIYQTYVAKPTEAYYQLDEVEIGKLIAQMEESLKNVGAEVVLTCETIWSAEPWLYCGTLKFPDIEAVQKHAANLMKINWYRYVDGKVILGIEAGPVIG